jgi:hypothetical protein
MMPAAAIDWVLLVTGLATASALVLFLAPVAATNLLFGQAPADAPGRVIVRHWGLLVGLVGALLVYAAYHAEIRVPTLCVAVVEKVAFALGVILSPLRRRPSVFAVALADAGMAAVYLWYLATR